MTRDWGRPLNLELVKTSRVKETPADLEAAASSFDGLDRACRATASSPMAFGGDFDNTQLEMVAKELRRKGYISRLETVIRPEEKDKWAIQLPARIWYLRHVMHILIDTKWEKLPSGKRGARYELRYFDVFGRKAWRHGA